MNDFFALNLSSSLMSFCDKSTEKLSCDELTQLHRWKKPLMLPVVLLRRRITLHFQ